MLIRFSGLRNVYLGLMGFGMFALLASGDIIDTRFLGLTIFGCTRRVNVARDKGPIDSKGGHSTLLRTIGDYLGLSFDSYVREDNDLVGGGSVQILGGDSYGKGALSFAT